MGARRTLEAMERDAQAADLYRRGLTYRQIATQMGWRSPSAAFGAVRRAARDSAKDPLAQAEALALILDRLQDYRRLAWRVATTAHYVTTQSGKLVTGPDGNPLRDDAPVLASVDRLLKLDQEEARLRDLYPAAKSRVEVITEDAVDAELKRLAEEIAQADRQDPADADASV